jgi:hypothetical protein
MERTSPDYNDPQFNKKSEDSPLDKYEAGFDKAFNAADKVYSAGRKIGYIFMGFFFLFIGAGMTVWGIFNYSDRLDEMNSFEKTIGTVVKMREVPPTDNSGETYAPVIEYTDAGGRKFVYESKNSSDPPAYVVGEKVNIRYDKSDPEDVFIDTFWGKWSGTLTIFVFPLVIFPLGMWMLFSAFSRKKSYSGHGSGQGSSQNRSGSSYVSIG